MQRHSRIGAILVVAAACWVVASGSAARVSAQGTPQRSVWDGAYTAEQAMRGREGYNANCVRCHAMDADGRPARFMGEKFWDRFGDDTLNALFTPIRKSMPNNAPGSLSVPVYLDIVAYLLQQNDLPAGSAELTEADLSAIQLVKRTGPSPIPAGSLVAVAGCLVQDGSNWSVTNASAPIRIRPGSPEPEPARMTPAGHSIALKYLLVAPTRLKGQWVIVRGLTLEGGEALNVSTIVGAQPACPN